MKTIFLLHISDQAASTAFYEKVLGIPPRVHLPGMTEFQLMPGHKVVLKLDKETPGVQIPGNIPPVEELDFSHCAACFFVPDPKRSYQIALLQGAVDIDGPKDRAWGYHAAFVTDPDGNMIAFASSLP